MDCKLTVLYLFVGWEHWDTPYLASVGQLPSLAGKELMFQEHISVKITIKNHIPRKKIWNREMIYLNKAVIKKIGLNWIVNSEIKQTNVDKLSNWETVFITISK